MSARRAFITGITGQDGSYLAELLSAKGYEVHGLFRAGERELPLEIEVHRHEGDIADVTGISRIIGAAQPDECYHLAAQTFVVGEELSTIRINVDGTLHLLQALRDTSPHCRLFLAGSSEMFGDVDASPQTESTPLRPRNVYGVSKTAAYQLMRVYRQQHGLFACCGILYNHESPRRGPHFVTRKITQGAARISSGQQTELLLGNLDAVRDWGHARDYVRAMWLMLQQETPEDYVIATGHARTVRDFVAAAFASVDLDWERYVRVSPEFFRPAEKMPFVGDASKAAKRLGWRAETAFADLVAEMVNEDRRATVS